MSSTNPYDIDSTNFNSEMYLERLLKMGTLKEIMDKEYEIISEGQHLQSEMQTLVYENYNKFISATDTIRKMRSDFKTMQLEMMQLNENMEKMTSFSAKISNNLRDNGHNVNRLCATRQLLDRLQFLFLMPSQLNKSINDGQYAKAVEDYVYAQRVLVRYGGQPSFQSIQEECEDIIKKLKVTLKQRLLNTERSAIDLAESARLLVQLQVTDESLDKTFLFCSETRLEHHLKDLTNVIDTSDILEWVDKSNSGLLTDLNIIVSSYNEMFSTEESSNTDELADIVAFADKVINQYFELVQIFLKSTSNCGTEMLVRGLDKFHRHLQAMTDVVTSDDISLKATDIVINAIKHQGELHYITIKNHFKESLLRVRQLLAGKSSNNIDLREILNSLQVHLVEKIQASLQDLMVFLHNGSSFSLKTWCVQTVSDTCWYIIVNTLTNVADVVKGFSQPQIANNNTPYELLLILAKLCLELQDSGLNTLYTHMQKLLEQATPGENVENRNTNGIITVLTAGAQVALDAEVVYIGLMAAQMLRVSVLARDWLRAPEPRGPRAVCRRVVEALTSADTAAAQLFPMGTKQSSDSSKRTFWPRAPSSFSPLNRLFSERIEVFGPAGADRAALSAGALKIALKAFVECVRLRTFGRHGLQQLQVDVHFLQQRLACLGNDERLLSALLDDALASAQFRCVDPQLMEPSIVDVICERG